MCHFIRETADGVELRTRFWMGWTIVDQKAVKTLPDGVRIPEIAAQTLLLHNMKEFANLASFLPEIFAEEKNNW